MPNIKDLNEEQKKNPLKLAGKKQINFPFSLPSWVLNEFTVKAFNFLYYNRIFKKEINNVIGYQPFFYPLGYHTSLEPGLRKKRIRAIPVRSSIEAKNGLVEILRRISDKGMGSFLAVLKSFR